MTSLVVWSAVKTTTPLLNRQACRDNTVFEEVKAELSFAESVDVFRGRRMAGNMRYAPEGGYG